ncbi:hypothetical protein Slin14017_G126170 [Septoria linicola]|nr:hypothetical protein Slin14017_G126170 [Septoria linicola]
MASFSSAPVSHFTAVRDRKRKRDHGLSIQPEYSSLAQGTISPAPPDSPPPSPRPELAPRKKQSRPQLSLSRPPTAGGGPLSSHPTNEDHIPGAWPPTPDADMDHEPMDVSVDTSTNTNNINHTTRDRADSYITSPTSPTAPPMYPTNGQHRTGTVRRLFSLSSLRQSFSSSRTSLSQRPDTSHGSYQAPYHSYTVSRAESPSIMSTTASTAPIASMRLSNDQRPSTGLRKKRSSSWFKRKSTFFGVNDDGTLDVLDEDGPEHKRFKDNQLPTLPEIGSLGGGSLDGGSIGWDDQLFKRQ